MPPGINERILQVQVIQRVCAMLVPGSYRDKDLHLVSAEFDVNDYRSLLA